MGKIRGFASLFSSNLKYKLNDNKIKLSNMHVIKSDKFKDFFSSENSQNNLFYAYFDNLTTLSIYEGLLVKLKIKNDYSHDLYDEYEKTLNLQEGTITFTVLNHICSMMVKALEHIDVMFYYDNPMIRFIIKSIKKENILYINLDDIGDLYKYVFQMYKKEKIVFLVNYSELFKVQYSRLKDTNDYRERFDFSALFLSYKEILADCDKSNYFDLLDKLKVSYLKYSFNFAVIESGPCSFLLADYLSQRNIPVMITDFSIYEYFLINN